MLLVSRSVLGKENAAEVFITTIITTGLLIDRLID